MEYVKGHPFFRTINQKMKSYPYLDGDISCDILIIGGGIDGAVANYFLSQKYNVALVEKVLLGYGCSARATCLLEYQLDEFASALQKYMTNDDIAEIYKAGLYGIDKLEKLVQSLGEDCYFAKRPSLIYSDCILDRREIEKEYNFRKKRGFEAKLLTKENNLFDFEIDRGVLCENGGAEVDSYLLEKALIGQSQNQDSIFENTEIVDIKKVGGKYECLTYGGYKIYCEEVILATGFNFKFTKNAQRLCKLSVSYTIVTNPLDGLEIYKNTLIQDAMKPYHYMRSFPDGRIILGGNDSPLKEQISPKKAEKEYDRLFNHLKNMFPKWRDKIRAEYKFCGAFGSTENNLGIIGRDENGIINFLSCGANGIVNSMFGIEMVEDMLNGKEAKFEELFSPLRK